MGPQPFARIMLLNIRGNMSKRYLRLDIEYEFSGVGLYMASENIKRILAEDMPYAKIIFSRDTAIPEDLDRPKGSRKP